MGFTLIELLVSLTIISLLLSIAVPRYFGSVQKAEEAVLKENLYIVRDSIQKYYSDQGRYPEKLADLVEKKYLRSIPGDPITKTPNDWIVVAPEGDPQGGVYDIRSAAKGMARDRTRYSEW